MKKLSYYLILISVPAASAVAVDFPSARSGVAPFSQYGMIQNVQSYSSNPFYDMNGQYNQRTVPIVIDATGEEISTAECQYTVRALINSYCGYNNNCTGMKIDDIKPAIIVQLSNMNGNYINACTGYIDTAFDNYKSENYVKPNVVTGFPTTTYINKNTNSGNAVSFPEMSDVEKRTAELESLQNQNGANDYKLTATEMPKTINDVSFTDQIANKTAGYEKWKAVIDEKTGKCIKNCVYQTPDIETREETYKRQTDELTAKKALDKLRMSHDEFCKEYKNEPECTPKTEPVVTTPPAAANTATNTLTTNQNSNNVQQKQLNAFIEAMKKAKK